MGWFSHLGHFLSSVVKNESSHTGNLLGGIIHNPAKSIGQLALGAADPFSSKMWNKMLGTHFTPLVGQLGGETEAQFEQSERQGVDTRAGRTMTGIANAIAASEAGGYFAGATGLGGLSGSAAKTGFSKLIGGGAAALDGSGGSSMAAGNGATSGGSGTDWSSIIGGLGSLYSGVTANSQANGLQGILNNAYSFNSSRPLYAAELNKLMADPEKAVTSSPGYQAELDQALQASERTAASQGLTGSGTEAAALAFTGAQTEQSAYDKLFSQLSLLSGAQFDPAKFFEGQMSADQSKQNASSGMFSGLSSVIGGLGSSGSGSGGGLSSWFSNLFSSTPAAADSGSINLFADAGGP